MLKLGDHPFIRHESYVLYKKAALLDLALVQKAIELKSAGIACKRHADVTALLLARLQRGLLYSKETPRQIKAYCASFAIAQQNA